MTRYFNGGTQPLVLRWGEGVIMPGEHVDTDDVLGPPFTVDEEASRALDAVQSAQAEAMSAISADAVSGPQDAPQSTSAGDGPVLHEQPNGDVVNQAGEIVGHIDNQGGAA